MEKINWQEVVLPETNPDVRLLVPEKNKKPNGRAILVFPGGGYYVYSNSDRNIIPMWYAEHGYTCFVLLYSVREYAHYPAPLLDASKAVWYIRSHAQEYGIDQMIAIGLCNDELGYIVPPSDFLLNEKTPYLSRTMDKRGEDHYEETNSVGPDCAACLAEAFAQAAERLIRE